MAPSKRYRVKMRVKVRYRFIRNAGLTLSVCAAAVLIVFSGLRAARALSGLSPGRFLSFKARDLSVESPSREVSAEIERRMSGKIGAAFFRSDAAALAAGLKTDFPSLDRVEVERSFLRGRVSVRAVPESVVAKVRLLRSERPLDAATVAERYLAEDGRLLTENYGPEPADVFGVELRSGEGLARLAAFLKEFFPLSSRLLSRPVRLEYPSPGSGQESACRLVLANGASVLWGDFEFTEAKVARLNEVLADASGRVKGPLRVDMRYFGDGKVFVSKAGDI